jgi:guanylate kinase
MTNEQFEKEIEKGNVLEKYYREDSKTWYGSLISKINEFSENYDVVLGDLQIVGAKALKEHYNAVTIFVLPENDEVMERRIRSRAPMSDLEWQERLKHTKREMEEDMPFYDYKIYNKEGKLEETVNEVLEILRKEGVKFELK